MERARRDLAGDPSDDWDAGDLVRKDMMLHFGAFITESSGHLSEYLPYYRTDPEVMARYCGPEYDGESSFYARNWPQWRRNADAQRDRMLAGEESVPAKRSWEYASWIIEAREKNVPYVINANVPNGGGLIGNLAHDGVVEVATVIDRTGARPTHFGRLPAHMAAICASNMAPYDLAATAAIERSKEAAILAVTLDPLTAAVCSPAADPGDGARAVRRRGRLPPRLPVTGEVVASLSGRGGSPGRPRRPGRAPTWRGPRHPRTPRPARWPACRRAARCGRRRSSPGA